MMESECVDFYNFLHHIATHGHSSFQTKAFSEAQTYHVLYHTSTKIP